MKKIPEENISFLIKKINNSSINNKIIIKNELFSALDRISSYFYNKKVYLKRIQNNSTKKELKYLFDKIDIKKVNKIFFTLENMELHDNIKFENINGENILKKVKAKFLHSKRFFS